MRSVAFAAVCLLLAACGSSGTSDSSSGGGAGTSSGGGAGTASGGGAGTAGSGGSGGSGGQSVGQESGDPILVQLQLSVQLNKPPSTYALVGALDTVTGKPLDGATVTLTPLGGQPIVLDGGSGSPYQKGFASGWVESYELSVTHSLGSRTGIIVKPPSEYTIAIDPPPKVDTSSTVTWTPNGEADVVAYIMAGKYGTLTGSPLPDTGSFALPTTAFTAPAATSLTIQMQRARTVAVPQKVQLQTIVTAYLGPLSVQP